MSFLLATELDNTWLLIIGRPDWGGYHISKLWKSFNNFFLSGLGFEIFDVDSCVFGVFILLFDDLLPDDSVYSLADFQSLNIANGIALLILLFLIKLKVFIMQLLNRQLGTLCSLEINERKWFLLRKMNFYDNAINFSALLKLCLEFQLQHFFCFLGIINCGKTLDKDGFAVDLSFV